MRQWMKLFETQVPEVVERAARGDWPKILHGFEVYYMILFIEAQAYAGTEEALNNFDEYVEEEEGSDDIEGNRNWEHLKNAEQVAHLKVMEIGSFEEPEFGVADPEVADHYATLKTKAPPILIVDGMLQDGNHRLSAARKRGETSILAYVVS